MTPYTEGKGRPKKETEPSRSVGGRCNNQGNLHTRLVLGGYKMCRSQHLPSKILKVYIEALTSFSHIYTRQIVPIPKLSQGSVLEMAPVTGTMGGVYVPRTEKVVRSL